MSIKSTVAIGALVSAVILAFGVLAKSIVDEISEATPIMATEHKVAQQAAPKHLPSNDPLANIAALPVWMLIDAKTGQPLSNPTPEDGVQAMTLDQCIELQTGKTETPDAQGHVKVHSCAVRIGDLPKEPIKDDGVHVPPVRQLKPYNDNAPDSLGGLHQKETSVTI